MVQYTSNPSSLTHIYITPYGQKSPALSGSILCRIHYAYGGSICTIFGVISYKESHDEKLLRLSTFILYSSTAAQLCLYSGNSK
jgi:hypothetical protein